MSDRPNETIPPHPSSADAIDKTARECFEKNGVFPISFCLPHQKLRPFREKAKEKELSFIVPGDRKTFVFTDEPSYMNEYQVSKFAVTRKKGGWDCVRHLEIMAASCLPLFQKIEECPEYTMIHYPKGMFREIRDRQREMTEAEYDAWVKRTYDWFSEHLTSDRMVDYMLRVSKNTDAKKVLFIDGALPKKPDCQSAMILGGLKNRFKSNCEVAFPVECLYQGRPFPRKPRWWKTNFNIYQVFDDSYRSQNEISPNRRRITEKIAAREYDVVVYGSITRSLDLFKCVIAHYPKEKVLCINGDDDLLYGPPEIPRFKSRLKQRIRNFIRRDKLSGPQRDPSLSAIDQWRKLHSEIRDHATIFMRELAV